MFLYFYLNNDPFNFKVTQTEVKSTDPSPTTAASTAAPASARARGETTRTNIRLLRQNPELSGQSFLRDIRTRLWHETGTKQFAYTLCFQS